MKLRILKAPVMLPGISTPYGDYQPGTGRIIHIDGLCLFGDFQAKRLMQILTTRDPVTLFLAVTPDLARCPIHDRAKGET